MSDEISIKTSLHGKRIGLGPNDELMLPYPVIRSADGRPISFPDGISGSGGGLVNVQDFNAIGDGIADDTDAINDAIDAVRASVISKGFGSPLVRKNLIFPPGVYKCGGSLNFTQIKGMRWSIVGNGAVIDTRAAGKIAMDFLGSARYNIYDLNLVTNTTDKPTYGIAVGRNSTDTGGKANFNGVEVEGYFTGSSFYEYSPEVNLYNGLRLTNYELNGYVLIEDGNNWMDIQSDFTSNLASGTQQSYEDSTYIQCEFRHLGHGIPILLLGDGHTKHHWQDCYVRTDANVCIMISRSSQMRDMIFEMHGEAPTMTKYLVVDNDTPPGTINLSGFKFHDAFPEWATCMIDTTGSTQQVNFDNMEIRLNQALGSSVIFGNTAGDPSKLIVTGTLRYPGSDQIDLRNCRSCFGMSGVRSALSQVLLRDGDTALVNQRGGHVLTGQNPAGDLTPLTFQNLSSLAGSSVTIPFSTDATGFVTARIIVTRIGDAGNTNFIFEIWNGSEYLRPLNFTSDGNLAFNAGLGTHTRRISAAGDINVIFSDHHVVVAKTVPADTILTLPDTSTGRDIFIWDGSGTASTHNLTVIPFAGTINGVANHIISTDRAVGYYHYDGTQWLASLLKPS